MVWIALVIVEFLVWWGVLAVGWKRAATGDRVLGAFILTTGQHCVIGYLLGSIGRFEPVLVLLFHVTVLWGAYLVASISGRVSGAWWGDARSAGHWVRIAMRKPIVAAMTAIVAAEVGLLIYYAMHMPPMSYDGWGYHMVKAVLLAETGWIQPWWWNADVGAYVPGFRGYEDLTSAGGYLSWFTFFYPANGPVLMAYPLAFGFGLRATCLVQVPFAFMMALAVYRIVRRVVGAGVEWSAVCGLGVFGLWTVMGQMWFALGDVMSAGLLWAGYSLVMVPWHWNWFERNDEPGDPEYELTLWQYSYWPFILSGLAAGLSAGTKLGSLYWALGIMCLAIYKAVKR